MKSSHIKLLIIFFLITITYTAFSRTIHNDFIGFDDDVFVTNNPYIKEGLSFKGLQWSFSLKNETGLWIPLSWLSLMLDAQLYGLHPGGYHLTNLLIHILNVLILFLVFEKMTGALWQSAFIAILFAVHPLRVESVAWIAERKDVLSAFFFMITLWAYTKYIKDRTIMKYLWIPFFFILSLMAKPMMVTVPFLLLLLDLWPLGRINRNSFSSLFFEKIPLFLIILPFSIITLIIQKRGGALIALETIPLKSRILNAFLSYIRYIGKAIIPRNLAVFYPYPKSFPIWQAGGSILILIGISAYVIITLHKPYLFTGWFWYLGALFPVIGLMQSGIQSMADRYTYIPLIGLLIIIAWGIPDILSQWRYRNITLSISAGIIILILMVCAWIQVGYWKESTTLFTHTLAITQDNWLMHYNLGLALIHAGKSTEGMAHYQEALSINPNSDRIHNNFGAALMEQGNLQEAIAHFRETLRINPRYAIAHLNIGIALAREENLKDALYHYKEAIRLAPDFSKAHFHLGLVLLKSGDTEGACREYNILKDKDSNLAALLLHEIQGKNNAL